MVVCRQAVMYFRIVSKMINVFIQPMKRSLEVAVYPFERFIPVKIQQYQSEYIVQQEETKKQERKPEKNSLPGPP